MALTSLARLPPSMRAQLEVTLKKGVDSLEGVDPMPSIGVPAAPREEPPRLRLPLVATVATCLRRRPTRARRRRRARAADACRA